MEAAKPLQGGSPSRGMERSDAAGGGSGTLPPSPEAKWTGFFLTSDSAGGTEGALGDRGDEAGGAAAELVIGVDADAVGEVEDVGLAEEVKSVCSQGHRWWCAPQHGWRQR